MAEPAVADEGLRQNRDGFALEPAAFDPARRAEGLWRLFEAAHVHTQVRIVDYAERAEASGAVARRIRIAALSLAALGALTPMLVRLGEALGVGWAIGAARQIRENAREMLAIFPGTAIGWGLLAFAAGLALFDQMFGASRSWMRDRQTQARLEALAVGLRYAWAARLAKSGCALSDAATAKDLAGLILTHVSATEALTETESGDWAEQVRTQLDAFDPKPASTEAAAPASRPQPARA